MIRHFEPAQRSEPEGQGRFQLGPALKAGLIAGILLLLIPRGSPWSGISFFSSVMMGRPAPNGAFMLLPVACLVHLLLSEVYALGISWFISNVTQARAVIIGSVIGLMLYLVNLSVVSIFCPDWRTNEAGVLFTHAVFGAIVGGAYRGLRKRKLAGPLHQ